MAVIVHDSASSFSDRDSTRRTAVLADGSLLVWIKTDATHIACYHSSDRINFIQKIVIDLESAQFSAFSFAIEANNNLQVVYQTTATNSNLVWSRYTYAAGVWTHSVTENIYTDAVRITGSVDIDVLGNNIAACTVIWRELTGTNGQRVYAKSRGSNNTWGTQITLYTATASNQYSPNESVSCTADVGGPVSNEQRVLLCAITNSQTGSNGAFVAVGKWNILTGSIVDIIFSTDTFPEHIFTGNAPGASHRILSFPKSANIWYGVSFSNFTNNQCNVKAFIVTWTGSEVILTYAPTFAMPASTLDLIKPSAVKLSNDKISVFTRGLSTGGIHCAVIDMTSLTFSPSFLYSLPLLGIPLTPFAGAQRNVVENADVIMVFGANGVTYSEVNIAPGVPTNIVPVAASVIDTDLPLLQATLPVSQFAPPRKARWQLATDSGFTSNVRTVTEPDTDYDIFEVHNETIPLASELIQGNWFIKALTIDVFGKVSAYSASHSFSVSHVPEALNLTPDNATREYGILTVFDWDFSDVSSIDFQTALQIIVERLSDGVNVVDTGKVVSTNTTHSLIIPLAGKDLPLRWKVRLWDSDDIVGPYSEYKVLRVSDKPTVTITHPDFDEVIDTPTPTITWTYNSTSGSPQSVYRVIIKDRTVLENTLHDSGLLTGVNLSYELPSGILTNGNVTLDIIVDENGNPITTEDGEILTTEGYITTVDYKVTVEVFDSFGLQGSDTNNFSTDWEQPDQPVFTATNTNFSNFGYHLITWDNSFQDATFVAYRIYRRVLGESAWSRIFETTQTESTYAHEDWLANADTTYEYTVVQSATRFGSQVESSFDQRELLEAGTADYWLIHPIDSSKNFKLSHVTSEDFVDEYESEVLYLIDRGRKVDYGTRWGYAGTLTCQVWDEAGRTARESRLLLESLKRSKTAMYLKNPFGDSFLVDMQNLSIERMPGVGTQEFHTLTIPYLELEGQSVSV